MKRFKAKEIIKMLEKEGWILHNIKGSHRQFKHPNIKGKVTVNGKLNKIIPQNNLHSIFKQAGWK